MQQPRFRMLTSTSWLRSLKSEIENIILVICILIYVLRLGRLTGGANSHANSFGRSFGNVAPTGRTDFDEVIHDLGITTVLEEDEDMDNDSSDDGEIKLWCMLYESAWTDAIVVNEWWFWFVDGWMDGWLDICRRKEFYRQRHSGAAVGGAILGICPVRADTQFHSPVIVCR